MAETWGRKNCPIQVFPLLTTMYVQICGSQNGHFNILQYPFLKVLALIQNDTSSKTMKDNWRSIVMCTVFYAEM